MQADGQAARKRLRTAHACDLCRARKSRCNGNQPCDTCVTLQQDCTFGGEAGTRGKSELILAGVLRIEQALLDLNRNVGSSSTGSQVDTVYRAQSATSLSSPLRPALDSAHRGTGVENAVLDSKHTSTTEAILQWPHFDSFPSLKDRYVSIFQLEHQRRPWKPASATMQPYIASEEVDDILIAFEDNINFWYPTTSRDQLKNVRDAINSDLTQPESVDACLALLVLALGCASQVTAGLARSDRSSSELDNRRRNQRRRLGDMYFSSALKKIYVAHMEVSSQAAQCLLFTALYFASLTRPLQAREYLSATCSKCLLLISYPPEDEHQVGQERIRRIFWSCFILESDYIAELSACPPSGISHVESSVPLPQAYTTHASREAEEQASMYFLACISIRRLLNRVHQLLYAKDSGAAGDSTRFPYVVAELNQQLEEWRDVLPMSFSFKIDLSPAANEAAAFLRQRYLTCRSVIYRPYLTWLLSPTLSDHMNNHDTLSSCKICLESCLMHILNLRSFAHTVLIDSWICSLSMAGTMLLLLAACQVPRLQCLVGRDFFVVGEHLQSLLGSWSAYLGTSISPSVAQSIRIIEEADMFIKEAGLEGQDRGPEAFLNMSTQVCEERG